MADDYVAQGMADLDVLDYPKPTAQDLARDAERRQVIQFYQTCPACSGRRHLGIFGEWHCDVCGAVFGGVDYSVVRHYVDLTRWAPDAGFDNAQYFDFTYWDLTGKHRVHGWVDRTTKQVVQIG